MKNHILNFDLSQFVLFFCFWIFDIFDIFPNSNFDLLAETKVNNETAIFFRKINPNFGKLRRQGRVFKQDQMLKLRGHKLDNFSNGLLSEKWLLLHWHHFEDSHEKKKSLTRLIMFMSFVLVRTLINLSHIFPTTVKSDSRKWPWKIFTIFILFTSLLLVSSSFQVLKTFWKFLVVRNVLWILNESELMKNPRCLFLRW